MTAPSLEHPFLLVSETVLSLDPVLPTVFIPFCLLQGGAFCCLPLPPPTLLLTHTLSLLGFLQSTHIHLGVSQFGALSQSCFLNSRLIPSLL